MRTIVVVGAGVCGGAAVEALRDEGFDGRLLLVGDEPHAPYERPPLSKEYLRGAQERSDLFLRPEAWYRDHGVEFVTDTRAVSLDAAAPSLTLDDGSGVRADAVLLATGGRPRALPGPPSERVLTLRTLEDADAIRRHLGGGRRLVVVGAGFIGTEVAATARTLGTEVIVLDAFDVPLRRAVGPDMGRVIEALHRDHGVAFHMGDPVVAVEETRGGVVADTAGGASFEADAAVVGIAITPSDELARQAGMAVDDGVLVDEWCRTSAEAVFAAGDVASHFHPVFGRRIRVEHYDNALKHGAAAARNILGRAERYADPHWFWSDQYEAKLQMAGLPDGADRLVVRGSVDERRFVAFYLREGMVVAAFGLDRGRDVRRALRLIAARARPDPSALRDEDVDLRTLVLADGDRQGRRRGSD